MDRAARFTPVVVFGAGENGPIEVGDRRDGDGSDLELERQ